MKAPYDIIKRSLITEKSTDLKTRENKYTFEVDYKANKIEIKKALEEMYKVKVLKVNTLRMKGKMKRVGLHQGRAPHWKKAVATLKQGDIIEGFGA